MIIISIIEKLLIIYFTLYIIIDMCFYLSSFILFTKRSKKKIKTTHETKDHLPLVSVIVPAYNEEISIELCIKMLLKLDYENYQLIVVNDGSKDKTLEQLLNNFDFALVDKNKYPNKHITTSIIKDIYQAESGKLLLIDKANGGKADAINTAINIAEGAYICTIDADSILDSEALRHVILPLIENEAVFVSGGQIALSNDLTLINNKVVSARMPKNILVLWQILEYISTFMIARISLSKINALLIMSGAFSIYRKKDLLAVGGFLTKINDHPYIQKTLGVKKQTITEDMEIVLRLWRYYRDNHRKARAVFLPAPICWTEAPEKPSQLFKQRMRWHQGLAEVIWLYRDMIFELKYGMTGMLAIPYYFFMELLSPVIKLFALSLIIVLIINGTISQQWVAYLTLGTILVYTIILSTITVIIEKWSMLQTATNRDALRYKGISDWIVLLLSGILANFTYAFYRMFAQLKGIYNFFLKQQDWRKFERKGIQ